MFKDYDDKYKAKQIRDFKYILYDTISFNAYYLTALKFVYFCASNYITFYINYRNFLYDFGDFLDFLLHLLLVDL